MTIYDPDDELRIVDRIRANPEFYLHRMLTDLWDYASQEPKDTYVLSQRFIPTKATLEDYITYSGEVRGTATLLDGATAFFRYWPSQYIYTHIEPPEYLPLNIILVFPSGEIRDLQDEFPY
jgi:hypothetical protein